jgi:hypothetical protein
LGQGLEVGSFGVDDLLGGVVFREVDGVPVVVTSPAEGSESVGRENIIGVGVS